MKFSIFIIAFALSLPSVFAHGIGGHTYLPCVEKDEPDKREAAGGKSFEDRTEESRWFSVSFTAGWDSREMHYGVDETGKFGAYTTNLALRLDNLVLNAWAGYGTPSSYREWDFSVAYLLEAGPIVFVPGYNFRYQPGQVEHGHGGNEHEAHGHEHGHEEHGHQHEPEHDHQESSPAPNHTHKSTGHELFFVLAARSFPFVTPSTMFVWDLSNTPGAYMEFRLDGNFAAWRERLVLNPYALLGLNFGYNTRSYYGWNNFQFGLKATWKVNAHVSFFAGVNYSVALRALEEIDQGNEVWINLGVNLSY